MMTYQLNELVSYMHYRTVCNSTGYCNVMQKLPQLAMIFEMDQIAYLSMFFCSESTMLPRMRETIKFFVLSQRNLAGSTIDVMSSRQGKG